MIFILIPIFVQRCGSEILQYYSTAVGFHVTTAPVVLYKQLFDFPPAGTSPKDTITNSTVGRQAAPSRENPVQDHVDTVWSVSELAEYYAESENKT